MAESPFFIPSEQSARSSRFDYFVSATLDTIHAIKKNHQAALAQNALRLVFSDDGTNPPIPELVPTAISGAALAKFEQVVNYELSPPNVNSCNVVSLPQTITGRLPLLVIAKNDHSHYRLDETRLDLLPEQITNLEKMYDEPALYIKDFDEYTSDQNALKNGTPILLPRYKSLPALDIESATTISSPIGFWGEKPHDERVITRYWNMRPLIMMRDVLNTDFSIPAIPTGIFHQLAHAQHIIDNTGEYFRHSNESDMGEKTGIEQTRSFINALQEIDAWQYSHVHSLVTDLYRCLAPVNPTAVRWPGHPEDANEYTSLQQIRAEIKRTGALD